MKIDACLIIKNEIENIENLVRQLEQFCHKICIAETGSTDGTKEWLEEEAKKNDKLVLAYYEWTMSFANARNFSWGLSTDADYRFWCDGDDLLNDELLQELIDLSKKEINDGYPDVVFIRYQYNPTLDLYRERLIRTRCTDIKWNGFIHEYLNYNGAKQKLLTLDPNKCIIHHHVHAPGDKMRNFNHFNANVLPSNREVFYFGRECNILGYPMLGAMLFQEALEKDNDWECNLISALTDLKYIQDTYKYDFKHKWYEYVENLYNRCAKNNFKRCDLSFLMGYYTYYIKKDIDKAIEYYIEAYNSRDVDLNVNDFLVNRTLPKLGAPLDLCVIYANEKHDYEKAMMWNNKVLEEDPNNKAAIGNNNYLQKIINEKTNINKTKEKKTTINFEEIECPEI